MEKRKVLGKMKSWKKLHAHFKKVKEFNMREMFEKDKDRFEKFHLVYENMLFDFSKNRVSEKTMRHLYDLAKECQLSEKIEAMFRGDKINITENRSVLHTALRNRKSKPIKVDGSDIMPQINEVFAKIRKFSDAVRFGEFKGHTGKKLTNIVNIGIGGSDLGPVMVTEALKKYWAKDIHCHFISNIDGTACAEVLSKINPEETLFIVASKTFTTIETLTNARTCRRWLVEALGEHAVSKHFVALSTNKAEVEKFGIDSENMFEFWDYIGGRYSVWSAIGLPIVIAIGMDNFEKFLDGAAAMDKHFRTADFEHNIPVTLALLGVLYNNFFDFKRYAVIAYDQYLKYFPAYLQQLDMESNGKTVDLQGNFVDYSTGPVIFGGAGTDVQHSFFQQIHQGTDIIPCDFIVPAISHNEIGEHHDILMSNVLAQAEALMKGKTEKEVAAEMKKAGKSVEEVKFLKAFKTFSGNRPSNMILFKKIDPFALGMLVAMYEHKVFVQGVIWNIDSYDQWGVELGKQMAVKIMPELTGELHPMEHDSSTLSLIKAIRKFRK
ncbi:MAG: glucose-6-phosphate isomerase [Alphaproteobacteria bacterium]|nr:glucose-6-phosphate isomerase [Alphaproteobacteria bacterium]